MKKITVTLDDKVAECIACDAKGMGLSSEELIKYVLGRYVQEEGYCGAKKRAKHPGVAIAASLGNIMDSILGSASGFGKELLKRQADEGALSCKRCTMKLTSQDIDNDKCGACGVDMKSAVYGDKEDDNPA